MTLAPGTYNVGGLRLRSRTTLHLKSGAVLKGARDCERYRILAGDKLEPARAKDLLYPGATWTVENQDYDKRVIRVSNTYGSNWNNAMIRIYDAVDVAIIGEKGSVLDGCNSYDATNEEKYRGVHGISVHYATNVVFRGLSIQHTGNWAFCVREARNLVFDDLDIVAGHDGPHFSTCNDVTVKNCRMATGLRQRARARAQLRPQHGVQRVPIRRVRRARGEHGLPRPGEVPVPRFPYQGGEGGGRDGGRP